MSTASIAIPQLGSTRSSAASGGQGTAATSGAGPVRDRNLRQLLRSIVLLIVLGAIVVALLAAVPSLGAVTRQLGHAQTGWVVVAVVAELASCFAFVFFFQGVFWRGPRRVAARVAWTEMAAGALLPVGGAGGLRLGAWILSKFGMPGRAITIRSSVVFLVTSAVNVAALALFGLGLGFGLFAGPQKPLLTLLPGLTGLLVIGLFLAIPGPLTRLADNHTDKHARPASMLASLASGLRESEAVLRHPNWRLLGAVGYWSSDVTVLWLVFLALGATPPFGAIAMGYLIGLLANALPIPGGIGAVDLGLVGMLAVYGAPLSTAAAAVLIYRAISLWVPTLVGTVAYVLLRGDLHRPISLTAIPAPSSGWRGSPGAERRSVKSPRFRPLERRERFAGQRVEHRTRRGRTHAMRIAVKQRPSDTPLKRKGSIWLTAIAFDPVDSSTRSSPWPGCVASAKSPRGQCWPGCSSPARVA